MQKQKNLLPGLFLCVFSRTAEPLIDFYCSNLLAFPPFLFGADFFCRKERYCRPILYRPILRADFTKNPTAPHERPQRKKPREPVAPLNAHLEIPTQKARRAHRAFTSTRLYLACRRAQKAPTLARSQPLKTTLLGPCTANLALFTHTKAPTQKPRE